MLPYELIGAMYRKTVMQYQYEIEPRCFILVERGMAAEAAEKLRMRRPRESHPVRHVGILVKLLPGSAGGVAGPQARRPPAPREKRLKGPRRAWDDPAQPSGPIADRVARGSCGEAAEAPARHPGEAPGGPLSRARAPNNATPRHPPAPCREGAKGRPHHRQKPLEHTHTQINLA